MEQQQQLDMGVSLELAAQALAATGSKSTLKATEWILNKRRSLEASKPSNNVAKGGGGQGNQSKLDYFFQGQTTSSSLQVKATAADDLDPGFRIESEVNSPTRGQDEPENSAGGSAGGSALVVATTTGPGAAREGPVGGLDTQHSTGAALGWRNVNSVRREQEDVGASGYAGGKTSELLYPMVKVTSMSAREEEGVGGSSSKLKRAVVSPGQGDFSSAGFKRLKQHTNESNPGRAPAPHFFSPQSYKPDQKQKVIPDLTVPGRNSLAPLAERMRPATIDEVLGQDHLLGPRHMLRSLLDNGTVPSIILFGPPGTGKTSLARAIARTVSGLRFVGMSAVNSGAKEVKEVLHEASKRMKWHGQRTLLFLDEVHRFNKAQQDLFLPSVEAGDIIFIGATTENPSFEINAALLSRCRVLTLLKLEPEHLRKVLERAIADRERGVLASLPESISSAGECAIEVEEKALTFLAGAADGDARVALNAIEMAATAAYSEAKLCIKSQSQEVAGTVPTVRLSGLERVGSSGLERVGSSGLERVGSSGSIIPSGKKEPPGPSMLGTDRAGNGSTLLEALIENVKESSNSKEDYTKPFKRFVGGKEVTPVHNPTRFEREVVSIRPGDGGKDAMSLRLEEPTDALDIKGSTPDAIVPGGDVDVPGPGLVVILTLGRVQEAFQRSHVNYDKTGEEHYNIISALHKSMRGGDADAAIYWLARMLEGGEGPLYVARRLVRFASEDVGLADPHAMGIAVACYQACHFLGMPECNVNLAQCVVYLAYAPKSVVVYQAIESAQKLVRETQQNEPVPLHLRNAPTKLMKDMGYGKGYIYPPGHAGRVEQEYMPPSLQGCKFLQWPDT